MTSLAARHNCALFALCWKCRRTVTVAVVAGMLGLTLAGSNGALAGPSRQLVASVRTTVDSMSASMFGGRDHPANPVTSRSTDTDQERTAR